VRRFRYHNLLTLDVSVDESVACAEISVGLGLIVTKVANALKHFFPDHASGTIKGGYHSNGPAWTLWVSDNGTGMPALSEAAHSGLGSSIVDALAKNLNASVEIADGDPGTTVSISNA
jgi:two-component system, sensor histidine kinase PdtaS